MPKAIEETKAPHVRSIVYAYRLRRQELFPAILLTSPNDKGEALLSFMGKQFTNKIPQTDKPAKRGVNVGEWETWEKMEAQILMENTFKDD